MAVRSSAEVKISQDELKKQAAWKAVEYVKSGMVLGLGTGSTAAFAVDRIGELLKNGTLTDIVGVPTSVRTYEQAKSTTMLWGAAIQTRTHPRTYTSYFCIHFISCFMFVLHPCSFFMFVLHACCFGHHGSTSM